MAGTRGTKGAGGSNRHISDSRTRAAVNSRAAVRNDSAVKRASASRNSERGIPQSAASERKSTAFKGDAVRPSSSMEQARRRRRRKNARRARQKMLIKLALLAVCVAIVWVATHFIMKASVEKTIGDDGKIAQNITIDGLDVGGMTKNQAISAFDAYVEKLGEVEITCKTDGGTVAIPLSSFGFKQDTTTTKELVEQAYNYGREGSVIRRFRQVKRLKKNTVDFDATYTIDETLSAQMLSNQCKVVEGAAVNGAIVHNGKTKSITESKNGIVVDTETTISQIKEIVSAADWDKKACTLEVATHEAEPEITTEILESIPDELGSYSTYYEGTSAKMQNVERGAELINGHLVMPGEVFDANAAMEPYTEDNGYTAGGSFNDGQIEQTLGGGICQVSTTLYNAVLYSELEVVERANHSMLVSYVEPGRDAAIADDVKNFVFRNNTENPIYIEAYTENSYLYMYIWGVETRPANRRIEFYSDETSRRECKVIYRADYDASFGSKTTKTYGYDGVEATLYKNIYVDDVKTDTELVNYSSYNLVDAVVLVGVDTENDSARSSLLEAIANQDEDVINSYCY